MKITVYSLESKIKTYFIPFCLSFTSLLLFATDAEAFNKNIISNTNKRLTDKSTLITVKSSKNRYLTYNSIIKIADLPAINNQPEKQNNSIPILITFGLFGGLYGGTVFWQKAKSVSLQNMVERGIQQAISKNQSLVKQKIQQAITQNHPSIEQKIQQAIAQNQSLVEQKIQQAIAQNQSSVEQKIQKAIAQNHPSIEQKIQQAIAQNHPSIEQKIQQAIAQNHPSIEQKIQQAIAQNHLSIEQKIQQAISQNHPLIEEIQQAIAQNHLSIEQKIQQAIAQNHPSIEEMQRVIFQNQSLVEQKIQQAIAQNQFSIEQKIQQAITQNHPSIEEMQQVIFQNQSLVEEEIQKIQEKLENNIAECQNLVIDELTIFQENKPTNIISIDTESNDYPIFEQFKKRIEEVEKQLADLQRELKNHRDNYNSIYSNYVREKLFVGDSDREEFASILDVLVRAEQNCKIIRVFDSAKQSAKKAQYTKYSQIYAAFEAIAAIGTKYFANKEQSQSMQHRLKEEFQQYGLSEKYKHTEREATINQYGKEREFKYQGEIKRIFRHLTFTNDDRRSLQIYFDFNDELKKVDIGYCGDHLHCASGR